MTETGSHRAWHIQRALHVRIAWRETQADGSQKTRRSWLKVGTYCEICDQVFVDRSALRRALRIENDRNRDETRT